MVVFSSIKYTLFEFDLPFHTIMGITFELQVLFLHRYNFHNCNFNNYLITSATITIRPKLDLYNSYLKDLFMPHLSFKRTRMLFVVHPLQTWFRSALLPFRRYMLVVFGSSSLSFVAIFFLWGHDINFYDSLYFE